MEKITFEIRHATRFDLAEDKKNLRYGQVFFLKSMKTEKFEGPYQISQYTAPEDLKTWLHFNMIYVPVNAIDNKVELFEAG